MSDKSRDAEELDRAYAEGRQAASVRGASTSDCPFSRQAETLGLRIAWLDGFADGAWEVETTGRSRVAGVGFFGSGVASLIHWPGRI